MRCAKSADLVFQDLRQQGSLLSNAMRPTPSRSILPRLHSHIVLNTLLVNEWVSTGLAANASPALSTIGLLNSTGCLNTIKFVYI
jgi:hypothetical protein